MAGRVVFSASTGSGTGLWLTDGTAAGTRLLRTFAREDGSGAGPFVGRFEALGGRAFFTAREPALGSEPWITDGSPGGTVLLKDLAPGSNLSSPSRFTPIGPSTTVFAQNSLSEGARVWVTDGSGSGTAPVGEFSGTVSIRSLSYGGVRGLTRLEEGRAIFSASSDGDVGQELWATDGSATGTVLLKDVDLGGSGSAAVAIAALGDGRALFAAEAPSAGMELWVTNGSAAGTVLVKDLAPGEGGSRPSNFFATGDGRALFAAGDGRGVELWISDGTAAGTAIVGDLAPGLASSGPSGFAFLGGGRFLFSADDGARGRELWTTDGAAGGTRLVTDINPSGDSLPTGMTSLGNGAAVFAATDPSRGEELWITDGTAAGTRLVADIRPGAAGSGPSAFLALGDGRALFTADDGVAGRELWVTDGTAAGTRLVADLVPGSGGSSPTELAALDAAYVNDAFRFFDAKEGGHFFTTSRAERDQVVATRPDLKGEGIGFHAFGDGAVAGTAPVYRFFDTKDGGHFFTQSAGERDQVLATRPDLRFEGVAFHEFTAARSSGTDAVYRFFNTGDGGHFFTASAAERDAVLATRPDLRFEGVAFHAPHFGVEFLV